MNDVPSIIKRRAVQKVQIIALLDFSMTKKKKKKKSESVHRLNFFFFVYKYKYHALFWHMIHNLDDSTRRLLQALCKRIRLCEKRLLQTKRNQLNISFNP